MFGIVFSNYKQICFLASSASILSKKSSFSFGPFFKFEIIFMLFLFCEFDTNLKFMKSGNILKFALFGAFEKMLQNLTF
jgi:hypothetical protein